MSFLLKLLFQICNSKFVMDKEEPLKGLDVFPVEVLERIFDRLDGTTFLTCRIVNRQWKLVIDAMFDRDGQNKYRKACLDSIPRNSLVQLVGQGHGLENQTPPHNKGSSSSSECYKLDNLTWVKWKDMFKHFQLLNGIDKWCGKPRQVNQLDIEVTNDAVSVVRQTGNVLLTGHESGLQCLWSFVEEENTSLLMDIFDQGNYGLITDLALGNVFHCGPYDLLIQPDTFYYSDHHFVISCSEDGRVFARGLSLCQPSNSNSYVKTCETLVLENHGNSYVTVKILGPLMAICGRNNLVVIYNISVPDHFERVVTKLPRFLPVHTIQGPSEMLYTGTLWPNKLAFWLQKVVCVAQNGQAFTYSVGGATRTRRDQWDTFPNRGLTLVRPKSGGDCDGKLVQIRSGHLGTSVDMMTEPCVKLKQALGLINMQQQIHFNTCVQWAKIFHDDLYVLLTAKRQMLLSVDGVFYRTFALQNGQFATAVNYHANVLFVGTNSGFLMAYKTMDPVQLMVLDEQKTCWTRHFDVAAEPIVDIDVAYDKLRNVITLAVAFPSDVKVIQWNNPSDKH